MTDIAALLADPHYMLHRIDPIAGTATFVPTTKALLSDASFLDGRTDFSVGAAVDVPLDALLQHGPPVAPGPDRMIFHVAFCGSTLLARLLAQDGAVHVLKEPNVLVDLANWQRSGADALFIPCLQLATACLRRRWSPDEVVVVKPTNWINNLLPDLLAASPAPQALFMTMGQRAYAKAVLRGGRDRLAFAARTAAHLAPSVAQGAGWLQSAIADTADPIGRAVNLALTALHIQLRLFGPANEATLDFDTVVAHPAEAARRASALLHLPLDPEQIATSAAVRTATNAKQPDQAFSASTRQSEDDEVERHHGATIDAALAWAERVLI